MNPSSRAGAGSPFVRIFVVAAALATVFSASTGQTQGGGFVTTRVTNASDCGGSDCVEPVRGLTGRNIDAHRGRSSMLVFLGLRGLGPTLFRIDKGTGQVENLGPLFDTDRPFAGASVAEWYFSARRPGVLYLTSGAFLLRYDVSTRAFETVFDAATEFGENREVVATHSSDGEDVHAALLRDTATGATLGCLAYREDSRRFFYHPAGRTIDRCLVDADGRRLVVQERADEGASVDSRIVDLDTGVDTLRPGVGEQSRREEDPQGNFDVTGQYFLWVGRIDGRQDAFIINVRAINVRADIEASTDAAGGDRSEAGASPDGATLATTLTGQGAPTSVREAPANAVPDPLRLPVATTAHVPLTAAYNALNVPARAAGSFYADPTTGVKIYKLTSATFPAASPNWGHDYSEGGDEVSLPYNGATRSILVRRNGGSWFLVDFTPGVGVGNGRALAGNLSPFADLAFTFSNNPATPYYAYVSNGSTIRRFDMRTMAEAPGNGWPVSGETLAMWLHQSENDSFFTWMRGANGTTIVGYEPATGLKKTYTNAGLNEPRIDRAGRYVGVSMSSPYNGLVVWDWQTNSVAWTTPGDPGIPFAHNASLRRRWMSVDWNISYPFAFTKFTPDVPNSGTGVGGPANGSTIYGNGNWIQNPANLDDQWALFSYYGGLRPPETFWLAPGGLVLITSNGQRRLLGHPYNATSNYTFYSFAKLSPDGRYVLFTSDMNGSGRSDLFLAEMPESGAPDTTPPTVAITAPAPGSTVSGTPVAVNASASDDVGVVGVQFKLDGANLAAEDTLAPFGIFWNTLLTPNGPHTLTAVARDAAGNSTTSLPVSVTVNNLDVVPPVISSVSTSNVTTTGATVTWVTNEPADSQVEYGTTLAYGSSTVLAPALVLAHSQALSGLVPATLYHYRVRSRDAAGNLALSLDATFTTLSAGTGLVAHWKLDEGSGVTAADSSGNGHTGSLVGGAVWTPGRIGQAVLLDGVDDHVSAAHAPDENAFPLTVSVWFQTTTASGARGVVNKYRATSFDGYQVFFSNGSLCAWYMRSSSSYVYDGTACTFSVAGYNDGLWHQAVFVVDATGGSFYVDGVVKGQRAWTGTAGPVTSTEPVRLGQYPGATAGTEFLPGAVDDVQIINQALTAAEVAQRYAQTPPPDTTPPVISAVAATGITATTALITWTTNEPSDSQVEYGPTTAYGSVTALDPLRVTAHARAINGLAPATLYHYRVKSRDAAGNLAVSGDFTLTTSGAPVPGSVAHWRLDAGSGVLAVDSSGNGNSGTLLNGPAWVPGRHGQALALDGVNDYVRVPHAAALDAFPLTVSVWFQTTSGLGTKGLVSKYLASSLNGYQIFTNNQRLCAWYFRDGANRIYDGGNCTLATTGYNDGAWHQAVFVVDAAGGRLYVDGLLKATRAWTGTPGPTTTAQELRIGSYAGAQRSYLPGRVDDIQVHNRAFTAAEVAALYNSVP